MKNQKIGFLSLHDLESPDTYIGSILITDNFGIPIEFKCTQPIKPTSIQKALYGEKLIPFIAITLCGLPLLKSLSNEPELIFVFHSYLLDIRPEIDTPIILIKRAGESIDVSSDNQNATEKHKIFNESGVFQPIVVQTHRDYKSEAKDLTATINDYLNQFDLIEPFDRMQKSVEILGKNDPKFR